MLYTDQVIACVDCGTEFAFTAREQEFYAQKGFASPPKRCKPCRNARKEQSGGGGSVTFSRSDDYGAPRERQMHSVSCAACGIETQVPFKPRGDRPVYCRPCFQKAG